MALQWVNSVFWIDNAPVIPEDRLDDCLKRAFRDKTDSYAVNGYDLKNAWNKIRAEESAARAAEAEIEAAENRTRNCSNRYQHEGDVEDGMVIYLLGGLGGTELLLPCRVCRLQAHAIRKQAALAALRRKDEPAEDIVRRMLENPHKYAVDAQWLLSEFTQAAGKKARSVQDPEERKFYVDLYNKLARAANYLRVNP